MTILEKALKARSLNLLISDRVTKQVQRRMRTNSYSKLLKLGSFTESLSSSWLQPSLETRYHLWSNYSTLPKLPVPPLRQTLQRFLAVAKPLATSKEEFDEVLRIVEEFGRPKGQGERLQLLLEKRANQLSNWLSDWWLQKGYLEQRCPLVINVSPGMVMPLQNYSGIEGQVRFAAKLIVGALKYREMIEKKELPPETAGHQPLDMSQYELLFGTTRIPGEKQDTLRYGCKETTKHNHVVVARNNKFFAVPVVTSSGDLLSEHQVIEQLKKVVSESDAPIPRSDAVGLLTTDDRGLWGKLYACMKGNNDTNANSLERIETSLFVLCLDQPHPTTGDKLSAVGGQLLHGGGSSVNTGNRWFDKCVQFVVGYDGGCGITYEHSPAEGPPVASLLDYTIDYVNQNDTTKDASGDYGEPEELEFVLSESDRNRIRTAAEKIDTLINDVEVHVLSFDHFGKKFPKSQKVSPDSFVQLGLQLAFHKMHGECPPTYETGTLRRYKLGRTDTIRLPTVESAHFVHCMKDKSMNAQIKAEVLRKAVQSHKDYTAAACSGNGIDRHLLGLKLTALEAGEEVPGLLRSGMYERMLHFKLSTSQVTSKHDACMMFGPMYSDCYGACYNPQEDKIMVGISAFNSNPATSARKFAQFLSESFLEMRDVLLAAGTKTAEKSRL